MRELTPLVLVILRLVTPTAVGTLDVLLVKFVSTTPAGSVMLAVFVTPPICVALFATAVTTIVNELPAPELILPPRAIALPVPLVGLQAATPLAVQIQDTVEKLVGTVSMTCNAVTLLGPLLVTLI